MAFASLRKQIRARQFRRRRGSVLPSVRTDTVGGGTRPATPLSVPRSNDGDPAVERARCPAGDAWGDVLRRMLTASIAHRVQPRALQAPSSSRTRRWNLAHTRARLHSVKRRCAVGPDGPKPGGSCRHMQPVVATNTMAASTCRSRICAGLPPGVVPEQPEPPVGTTPKIRPAPDAPPSPSRLSAW